MSSMDKILKKVKKQLYPLTKIDTVYNITHSFQSPLNRKRKNALKTVRLI